MTLHILDQPTPTADQVQTRHSILIVDADRVLANTLALQLEQQGFETETVNTGERGLQRAHQQRFSLIILEVRLPDTDGLTVCQKLDDAPDTCGIPSIILSGMARPDIIRRSRTAGCSYLVRKPCDPNALLALVRQAIRESEHGTASES